MVPLRPHRPPPPRPKPLPRALINRARRWRIFAAAFWQVVLAAALLRLWDASFDFSERGEGGALTGGLLVTIVRLCVWVVTFLLGPFVRAVAWLWIPFLAAAHAFLVWGVAACSLPAVRFNPPKFNTSPLRRCAAIAEEQRSSDDRARGLRVRVSRFLRASRASRVFSSFRLLCPNFPLIGGGSRSDKSVKLGVSWRNVLLLVTGAAVVSVVSVLAHATIVAPLPPAPEFAFLDHRWRPHVTVQRAEPDSVYTSLATGFDIQRGGFVVLCALVQAFLWTVSFVERQRFALHFPRVHQYRWSRLKQRLPGIAQGALQRAFFAIILTNALTFILRSRAISLVLGVDLDKFVLDPWGQLALRDVAQLFLGLLFAAFATDSAAHLVEINLTQPAMLRLPDEKEAFFAAISFDTYKCSSEEALLQHLAWQQLVRDTRTSPYVRSLLCFQDIHGRDWEHMLELLLKPIDEITIAVDLIAGETVLLQQEQLDLQRKLIKKASLKPSGTNPYCRLQIALWSTEVLSALLMASRKEDSVGVVQMTNSVATALRSMVACLLATDKYIHESLPRFGPDAIGRVTEHDVPTVRLPPLQFTFALESAISTTVTAFYAHIPRLQFSEEHAVVIRRFVEFQR